MTQEQQWTKQRILEEIAAASVKPIGGIGLEVDELDRWFMDSGKAHLIAMQIRNDTIALFAAKLAAATQRAEAAEAQLADCQRAATALAMLTDESEGETNE